MLCTNGSLQGLALLAEALFAGSGGRAIVEAPTYDRAILILRRFGATVEAVDLHADGLDVDAIEAACAAGRVPGLVYTIPNFQNPGGVTLSRAKRERLVALAREHGFLVLEDDPYGELRFDGDRRAAAVRAGRGRRQRHLLDVVHEDRRARPPHRRDGAAAAAARARSASSRSTPTSARRMLSEATVAQYCAAGAFEPGVARMRRRAARAPRRAGGGASTRTSATASRYVAPAGGYFLWLSLPGVDADALADAADAAGRARRQGLDLLHRRPRPRRAAARLLRLPGRRHGRGHRAARRAAVGLCKFVVRQNHVW